MAGQAAVKNLSDRAESRATSLRSIHVEKFGVERLVGLTQDQVDERVQEFIDLVQFDISLV